MRFVNDAAAHRMDSYKLLKELTLILPAKCAIFCCFLRVQEFVM